MLRAHMEKYLKNSNVVLDAGCGPKTRYFSDLPQNVYGIGLDINRENVEKAKKAGTGNTSWLVGSLQNFPFTEEVFDLIVCSDVLEHVKEPHKAIKELAMVLRKGGTLLITTTNVLNPEMFIDTRFPKISSMIIKRFGLGQFFERTYRFNPWTLTNEFGKYGLMVNLHMFGDPPIGEPWLFHFLGLKPPKIYYVWIVFDKLTNVKIFEKFKETMFAIVKKPS